jgi:hypothetical protein
MLKKTVQKVDFVLESNYKLIIFSIFLISLLMRALYAYYVRAFTPSGIATELEVAARSLAEHGVLGNIWGAGSGPSAHVSVVYAALMALEMRLFGYDSLLLVAAVHANAIVGTLLSFYFGVLIARQLSTKAIVPIAYAALLLLPLSLFDQVSGSFEQCLAGAYLMGMFYLAISLKLRGGYGALSISAFGAYAGFAILLSPALAPPVALLGLVLWTGLQEWPTRFRVAGLACLLGVLVVLPWGIRNSYAFGEFIIARSNFGLELAISNNADNNGEIAFTKDHFGDANSAIRKRHPFVNEKQAERLRAMGEIAFMRDYAKEAGEWIKHNPAQFALISLQRMQVFWFPDHRLFFSTDPMRVPKILLSCITSALMIFYLVRIFRIKHQLRYFFLVMVIGYGFPYYVTHVSTRYRLPIVPFITVCAVLALAPLKREPSLRSPG